jgi:hypothetical protein
MSELEKRASDAEREQAVVRLREASTDGRLTLEELGERTALAYRARTHADLEPLTADLPVVAASTAAPVASRRRWLIGVFAPVTRSVGEPSPSAMSCSRSLRPPGSTFARRKSREVRPRSPSSRSSRPHS